MLTARNAEQIGPPVRVVKVGGSLFAHARFTDNLQQWLACQRRWQTLLVVGGGKLADAVRQLDHRYGIPPQMAHLQAIQAMQVYSFLLRQLIPADDWITDISAWLLARRGAPTAILDPLAFMQHDEPKFEGKRLPIGWKVTSDSIAARVADIVGAEQLVLLKSTLPVHNTPRITYRDASKLGYVDSHFPIAAASFPAVTVVNLRAHSYPQTSIVRQ